MQTIHNKPTLDSRFSRPACIHSHCPQGLALIKGVAELGFHDGTGISCGPAFSPGLNVLFKMLAFPSSHSIPPASSFLRMGEPEESTRTSVQFHTPSHASPYTSATDILDYLANYPYAHYSPHWAAHLNILDPSNCPSDAALSPSAHQSVDSCSYNSPSLYPALRRHILEHQTSRFLANH